MNKQVFLIIALASVGTLLPAGSPCDNIFGKTSYTVQWHYTPVSPQHLSGYRERYLDRCQGIGGSLQAVVFGGSTVDRYARDWGIWFAPCNTCNLVAANGEQTVTCDQMLTISREGSPAFLANRFDILAQHVGIQDQNFQSTIGIAPQQSVIGGALSWKHTYDCPQEKRGGGYELIAPILHVRNRINLIENGTNEQASFINGQPANMTAALQRPAQCTSQFNTCCAECDFCPPCCTRSAGTQDTCTNRCTDCTRQCDECNTCVECNSTALANAELRYFYDYYRGATYRFQTNLGVIFPSTDTQPSVKNIFSPVAGHRHVGLTSGHSMAFVLWESDDGDWCIHHTLDLRSGYLFRRAECRVVELCNKPWSRYMRFYENKKQAEESPTQTVPGACCLTLPLEVTPRGFTEFTFAWIVHKRNWSVEAGWHMLCRQSEKIEPCLIEPFTCGIAGSGMAGRTQQAATIAYIGNELCDDVTADGSDQYIPIRLSDIDFSSAAHPSTISHEFYGALNFELPDQEYPTMFGLGGSFSLSADNAATHRWSVWGKLIVSV